jgi:hypothetical protein
MTRTIVVMAKAPAAGLVKTRLCPPCSAEQAAAIAEAALCDTLAAVVATAADRRIVALSGASGAWLPAGCTVVEQRGAGLAERLGHAVSLVPAGRLLIVGMDTPQCTPALLDAGFAALDGCDAALGPATDGGWWALGLRAPYPGVFDGVPMSAADTGARQLARLHQLGLRTALLPSLTDVDSFADAEQVAAEVPGSPFADAVAVARSALHPQPRSRPVVTAG